MPEVSVIIPVYNRAGIVGDAIRSVLAQTFEDYELIVVDDGSTDKTVDAILSFDDPRISLQRHERNKGDGAARNTGIMRATGRYVAFLDSDDLWQPAKLERQVTAMRTRQLPASFTWRSKERAPGKPLQKKRPKQINNLFLAILTTSYNPGTTMVVERIWYERVGLYDESIPCGSDIDWMLRFSRQSFLEIIEEDLATIRRLDAGVVGLLDGDPMARLYEIWATQEAGRPRMTMREMHRFRSQTAMNRFTASWRRGDRQGIIRHLTHATILNPLPVATWFIGRILIRVREKISRLHQ